MSYKQLPFLLSSALVLAAQLVATHSLATPFPQAGQLALITDAQAINRVSPQYPRSQAKAGQEGWSKMSFIVEPDGSVSNVVVQESSGHKGFDRASIKAIQKWAFTPAMENGQAIQQCRNSVEMAFKMSDSNGAVSRRFYQLYKKAKADLAQQDLVAMREKIDKLKTFKKSRFSEITYLSLLEASYAEQKGDQRTWLKHLTNAVYAGNDTLSATQIFSMLKQIYALQSAQNQLSNARKTYDRLIKMEQAVPFLEPLQKHKQRVEHLVDSARDITLDANIENSDLWHHNLVRNQFSLVNIVGNLTKLDVRCANKRHVFTVENNNTWTIPQTWQACSVFVYGEKNSQFQLIEHAFKDKLALTTASIN